MLLLIDNYDSFTHNVYQLLSVIGQETEVVRNDKISIPEIERRGYTGIVISPGPGTPHDSGISCEAIQHFSGRLPILGICLGHQAIAEVFGGQVVRAAQPVHGKTSPIIHDGRGCFMAMPQELTVGRYHSLIVDRESLPDCLEISAQTHDGIIMGLRHKKYKIEGLQFHPESILTPDGRRLLENFFAG